MELSPRENVFEKDEKLRNELSSCLRGREKETASATMEYGDVGFKSIAREILRKMF